MMRLIYLILFAALLTGCGESKNDAQKISGLNLKATKLEHYQSSYQEKFDEIYQHMNIVNQQFSKLNQGIYAQLNELSKNNHELLYKTSKNVNESFKAVHKEINDFGKALAKAGY